jgi:tetratricopeptide (TPR) repeat protein
MNTKLKNYRNLIKKYLKKYITCKNVGISFFTIFIFTIFCFRQNIYLFLGNQFFGGRVGYGKYYTTTYNIDTAEYFLLKANSFDKKLIWNNYQLSRINFIKGDLSTAIVYADAELRYFPDNCRTHYIRGLTYGYKNDLDAAIADFEQFNVCYPNSWAGHNDLSWFWFRKGNMQKVIEVVEKVIKNNDTNPWIQNTYGTALMNVGRNVEALAAFEKAKKTAAYMTPVNWGAAYPGNDPAIYEKGLKAMRDTVDKNIEILRGLEN